MIMGTENLKSHDQEGSTGIMSGVKEVATKSEDNYCD